MEVSIIMPVKNAAKTVKRAICSIQSQTLESWELVIVDDHSTDQTRQIVNDLSARDHRIRALKSGGRGIADALNTGISQSQCRYIARMDADDVSMATRLEKQISFLNENPEIGLVATRVNFKGNTLSHQGYAHYVDWTNSLVTSKDIRTHRFIESPIAHPSVMFRRNLTKKSENIYQSGHFPEDYELWLRWMDEGVKMAKLPEFLVDWYDLPDRLSRTDKRYSPSAFYETKAIYLASWISRFVSADRPIWIWGAGRVSRRRSQMLANLGITFSGLIDIDPHKVGGSANELPTISHRDIPVSEDPYIISYVGNRGAREDIFRYLKSLGFMEERDFLMAA